MTPRIRFSKFFAASLVVLMTGGVLGSSLLAHGLGHGGGRRMGMLGRLTRHLDLTEDQKARIREILESRSVQMREQGEAKRAARRALGEAVAAEPRDEAVIRARAAELGRLIGEGAVLRARIRSEIAPVLTAEQRAKLAEMKEKARERRAQRQRF